jgi:hypothetical protein
LDGGESSDSFAVRTDPKDGLTEGGEGPWLTPFVLGPDDPSKIYACYRDLWLGANTGLQWTNLTNGRIGASKNCVQVAVAQSDPKTIYVVKGEGWGASWRRGTGNPRPPFFGGGGVFRSTDGGANWQNVTANLPIAAASITNIAVNPTDARRAWVTFSGYTNVRVFETKNGGGTWTDLSEGLPKLPANTVVARKGPSNGVFVGLDVGVYYRDDALGWSAFFDDLPWTSINSLVIDETRQRIFAAVFGRGIWQAELPCQDSCGSPRSPRTSERPVDPDRQPGTYQGPIDIFEATPAGR